MHTLHIYRDDSDNAGLNYWHVKDNYEKLLLTICEEVLPTKLSIQTLCKKQKKTKKT